MDLFPLTSMNLKPGWESCCPNTGAEHRGTTESTHSLSLCPFRHRVLCHTVGLSNDVLAQPCGPLLPQLLAVVIWLWLTWGVLARGGGVFWVFQSAPGCSGVLARWSSLTSRPLQPFHLMFTSFTNTDSLGS